MMVSRWLGAPRIELAACGSTNDEAARLARMGAHHGTVVIAETQRAGRGREGRTWVSPPGRGLYLSAVLRPRVPLADVPPMTLAIGIGVCDAIRGAGARAALKWPNDVLVGERKISGVLVEAQSQGAKLESVIVGIGVNLTTHLPGEAPPEVLARATSLEAATGAVVDRAAFIDALLAHVEHWIDLYSAAGLPAVIPAWTARMAPGLVARATVDRAPIVGVVHGLAEDGALVLRDAAGTLHRVRSGDVETLTASAAVAALAAGSAQPPC